MRHNKIASKKPVALLLLTPLLMFILAGCASSGGLTLNESITTAKTIKSRAEEYAAKAPAAPYQPQGDVDIFSDAVNANNLSLTGQQIALIKGASSVYEVNPATLATIIELEIRHLDPGELDRDILSALAGDNTSIGIAQVRLSTAEEIEKQDTTGLFPDYSADESERTERIRRIAADDWSVLYAASYLNILWERFPDDDGLSLGQRYTGASPSEPTQESRDLRTIFEQLLN